MKNKAPLSLMEQLIMILVFALTSALCLQGFALADRISHRQERTAQAAVIAQNAAEILKYTTGDYEQAAGQLGGHLDSSALPDSRAETAEFSGSRPEAAAQPEAPGPVWHIYYDKDGQEVSDPADAAYLLQATPVADDNPLLGSAKIQVYFEDDLLFEIEVAWQEVS